MTVGDYRIAEIDGGFEPQMLYHAPMKGEDVWFPLNAQGYWLEPDAYSYGNVQKHAPLPTRFDAEQAVARAKLLNSDQKPIRQAEA